MTTVWTLAVREVVHFSRARARLVGAVAPPALFWALVGSGFGNSTLNLAGGGVGYSEYFFTGTLAMVLLFTSIFSAISLIEDRNSGFLQGVLVSPAPTVQIVLGKVLGGTFLATAQGTLFLLLAPLAGVPLTTMGLALTLAMVVLTAFALSALGVAAAWPCQSIQGFHAIMNLLLMPMWLLSGALFPASGAQSIVRAGMALNPFSYCVSALRHSLYWGSGRYVEGASWEISLIGVGAFCVASLALAVVVANARRYDG